MGKDRLAAFSDGVIAIIITIMVLELHVPHGSDASALAAIAPSFLSYVLSFIYVGIYWNNHHHLLHTVTRVDGLILWANLHLLFWLSIIPVTTAWMGQNLWRPAADGDLRRGAADAGHRLRAAATGHYPPAWDAIGAGRSSRRRPQGQDIADPLSLPESSLAFVNPWISIALYVLVAVIWLVPDRRIERIVGRE